MQGKKEPDDALPSAPPPVQPGPTQALIWVHDGPVCVTIVDLPAAHVPRGVCQCPACGGAHDPDGAVRFL
jgi:hypothetical protein